MSRRRSSSATWWGSATNTRRLAGEYVAKAQSVERADLGHECGHLFEITMRSALHAAVAGEPGSHVDANWWSEPSTVTVRAHDLPTALLIASNLPTSTWFPEETP